MGIEAGFKLFRPCPYLPDHITSAKRVLKLLMKWDWIPCVVWSEIPWVPEPQNLNERNW